MKVKKVISNHHVTWISACSSLVKVEVPQLKQAPLKALNYAEPDVSISTTRFKDNPSTVSL